MTTATTTTNPNLKTIKVRGKKMYELSFEAKPADICSSIQSGLQELPLTPKQQQQALMDIIQLQALEMQHLKEANRIGLFLDGCYKDININLNRVLKKPINFESEKDLRHHYFDLRESVKNIVQITKNIEKKKSIFISKT